MSQPDPNVNRSHLPRQLREQLANLDQRSTTEDPPPDPIVDPQPDPPVEPVDRKKDPAYWEARYATTDGIAKKQAQELSELRRQLEDLKKAAAPPPPPEPEPPVVVDLAALGYTPEQIEEYGEDHLRALHTANQRLTAKAVQAQVEPIRKELEEAKAREASAKLQVEERAKAEVDERYQDFLAAVTAKVPNWREINIDPMWIQWLTKEVTFEKDGILMAETRQELLRKASQVAMDVDRTVALFRAYLAEQRRPEPPIVPASGASGGQPRDAQPLNLPVPFTARGYREWKNLLARTRGIYLNNPELTRKIEQQFDTAYRTKTLPGMVI